MGNLHIFIIDYYDFDLLPTNTILSTINNNAYNQQLLGQLQPYVIIIPLVLSPDDLWKIINNKKINSSHN